MSKLNKIMSLLSDAIADAMLEALQETEAETKSGRKPLIDDDGDELYVIVNSHGVSVERHFDLAVAKNGATYLCKHTGHPHIVCQVMAPESGECPTVPVVTFTPTPERPHEWVIYKANGRFESRWFAMNAVGCKYWASELTNKEARRFPTATEAQDYIDENGIDDAYPWPVPKLTSSQ